MGKFNEITFSSAILRTIPMGNRLQRPILHFLILNDQFCVWNL